MSSNPQFNQSPNHFMVLDAISRGVKKIDDISKMTKISKEEVELIVHDLVSQRLIVKQEKKGFFRSKKVELFASETGKKLLESKKQELHEKSQRLQQLYQTGDKRQMQSFMDSNRMWIPMMLFSGIMDILFFTSMMSFMGMAMSPSESAIAEDQGGDAAADASDTGDTGGADTGDMSGSDIGMDSMDLGGFGDF